MLENTCLAGDIILYFPDMSFRILRQLSDWRVTINWCIAFTRQVDHIVDDLTLKMLSLFNQEVNEDERTEDYVNPYWESSLKKTTPKPKLKKKYKRGPSLGGYKQEL